MKRGIPDCRVKAQSLLKDKDFQGEKVMEMEVNLHALHHLLHIHIHKHIHPPPLIQPLLILINIPQKELGKHPYENLMLNLNCPCIMVK